MTQHGNRSTPISFRGVPALEHWDAASAFREALTGWLGEGLTVVVQANTRSVLTVRKKPAGPQLSVHYAFLGAPALVRRTLERDAEAWTELQALLPRSQPVAPSSRRGEVHDLQALVSVEKARLPAPPECIVGWGKWPSRPPKRGLRLGSCTPGEPPHIRVHPVLDRESVPSWFVGFVLYHELLHIVVPPIRRGKRAQVHSASFRAAERLHPRFADAAKLEREQIGTWLEACRRR